jgi:hypothetical protein
MGLIPAVKVLSQMFDRFSGEDAKSKKKRGLIDILVPYEARKLLFKYLSAYDIAKLDLSLNTILDNTEREIYLNPMRDLFWNLSDINVLLQEGMKLILLGKDIQDLEQRVSDTRLYLKTIRQKRRLQVYLVGSFPLQGKTAATLKGFMKFSVDGRPCKSRVFRDKIDLRRMRLQHGGNLSKNYHFLMAFGAPTNPATVEKVGFWYKVSDIPDTTVDLRVYVPCFLDRLWEEVRVPPLEIWRISGRFSSKLRVSHTSVHLFQVFFGKYHFGSSAQLIIANSDQEVSCPTKSLLMIVFSPSLAQFEIVY